MYDAGDDGIEVFTAGDDGVFIDQAGDDGFYVNYTGGDGIHVNNTAGNGLKVTHAYKGVSIATTTNDGFYVQTTGDCGLYVYQSTNDGVDVNTTNANHEYGIRTGDKIYAGSGYYPAKSGTFGRNTGSGTLEAGDIVCISGGYEDDVLGEDGVPVVKIEKANSRNSGAVFGVVEYKVFIREKVEEFEDGKTEIQKSFRFAEGDIMSGDYLAIIVFGPADVKVDNKETIKAGQMLTTGNGLVRKIRTTEVKGISIAENTGVLGKALEDSNGKGMIKVYVNCK